MLAHSIDGDGKPTVAPAFVPAVAPVRNNWVWFTVSL